LQLSYILFGFSLIPGHTGYDMDLHALRGVVHLSGRKGMNLGVGIGLALPSGSVLGQSDAGHGQESGA